MVFVLELEVPFHVFFFFCEFFLHSAQTRFSLLLSLAASLISKISFLHLGSDFQEFYLFQLWILLLGFFVPGSKVASFIKYLELSFIVGSQKLNFLLKV